MGPLLYSTILSKNLIFTNKVAKSIKYFNSWLQNSESFLQRITFSTSISTYRFYNWHQGLISLFCLYGSLAFKSQYLLILDKALELAFWSQNKF